MPTVQKRGTSAKARARFENYQPTDKQFATPIPGIVTIEVFRHKGESYRARTERGGEHKGIEGSFSTVMDQISKRFEKQLDPWRWYDGEGDETEAPDEQTKGLRHIAIDAHRNLKKDAHIEGLHDLMRRTRCGAVVKLTRVGDPAAASCPGCLRAE